jgi:hypothetical protein
MKNPLDFRPVTIPLVVSTRPTWGEAFPLPWICAMVCVGVQTGAAFTVNRKTADAVVPAESATWIVKLNGDPLVVLGVPLSVAPVRLSPGGSVPAICEKLYPVPLPPAPENVTE